MSSSQPLENMMKSKCLPIRDQQDRYLKSLLGEQTGAVTSQAFSFLLWAWQFWSSTKSSLFNGANVAYHKLSFDGKQFRTTNSERQRDGFNPPKLRGINEDDVQQRAVNQHLYNMCVLLCNNQCREYTGCSLKGYKDTLVK